MTEDTYLCVGGPLAGQRHSEEGIRQGAKARAQIEFQFRLAGDPKLWRCRYRKKVCVAGEKAVTLWVPDDQSPETTLELLLHAYERVAAPLEHGG
jgi:hypothetical protein